MRWQDLKQLQDERRRLCELEAQMQCSGALPGTRIHEVLQEHKRRLEARYRQALRQAGETDASDPPPSRSTW